MSRTNIVKILNEGQKWDIYTNYLEGNHKTKKALAKDYGISTRTLGRIIKEMENISSPLIKKPEYDYTVTKSQITIFCDEDSRSVSNDYPKFKQLRKKLLDNDFSDEVLSEVYNVLSLPKFVEKFSEGNITVNHEEGKIFYGSFEIKNSLVRHLMNMLDNKENVIPMIRFIEKLMDNPKQNVIDELYSFMKHNDIKINDLGNIVGYRSIRMDWTDHHSGKMSNRVGEVVTMPRTMVDDDPERTCSSGLHVGSWEYVESFGGRDSRFIEVEVCPSDVVSVPVDYDGQKMRVCKFKVTKEITQ